MSFIILNTMLLILLQIWNLLILETFLIKITTLKFNVRKTFFYSDLKNYLNLWVVSVGKLFFYHKSTRVIKIYSFHCDTTTFLESTLIGNSELEFLSWQQFVSVWNSIVKALISLKLNNSHDCGGNVLCGKDTNWREIKYRIYLSKELVILSIYQNVWMWVLNDKKQMCQF